MLYRALHIMSRQRYRLPVRRYIFDLFNIEIDKQVVEDLSKHGKELRMTLGGGDADRNRQSMINHPPLDDEEEDDFDDDFDIMTRSQIEEQPALSLRPVSRIVGFAAA